MPKSENINFLFLRASCYSIFENTKFSFEQILIQKKSLTKFVSSTDLKLHNQYCHSAHSIFPASTFRQVYFLFSEAKVSVRPSLFVYSSQFYTSILTCRAVGTQGGRRDIGLSDFSRKRSKNLHHQKTLYYYVLLATPRVSTFLRPCHVYFALIGGRKESIEGGNFVVSWLHYTAWLAQNLSLNF